MDDDGGVGDGCSISNDGVDGGEALAIVGVVVVVGKVGVRSFVML